MTARNPMKNEVTIVGIGATEYSRYLPRTPLSLGLEAARKAIEDAGLSKLDIDGVCGGEGGPGRGAGGADFSSLHQSLGIGDVTWCMNSWLGAGVVHAANAIFSGCCEVALVVQTYQRDVAMSSSAKLDPLRIRGQELVGLMDTPSGDYARSWFRSAEPYAGWAARYLHEFGVPREVFGLIAINNRTNASMNPAAVMRTPITMEDYLQARQIRSPLGLLDMDLPVDCAEAVVLTTAERARGLRQNPVHIHAATIGEAGRGLRAYENAPGWRELGPWVTMRALWSKSDLSLAEMDIFFPYDGFTPMSICFIEAAGYCEAGEAWDFLRANWDERENRVKVGGRVPFATNGGGLSHGRTGGFNFYTEAVRQLRGQAGQRQVVGARTALLGIGSFFHDTVGVILRAD